MQDTEQYASQSMQKGMNHKIISSLCYGEINLGVNSILLTFLIKASDLFIKTAFKLI